MFGGTLWEKQCPLSGQSEVTGSRMTQLESRTPGDSAKGQLMWPRQLADMGHSQRREARDDCPGRRCSVSPGEPVACCQNGFLHLRGQPSRAMVHTVCLAEKMAHLSTLAWPFLGHIPRSGVNVSSGSFPLSSCEDTNHKALAP